MKPVPLSVPLNEQPRAHPNASAQTTEPMSEYLKLQGWQIHEIKKGIAEMNAKHYTDHNNIIKHWERKLANSLGKGCQTKFGSN